MLLEFMSECDSKNVKLLLTMTAMMTKKNMMMTMTMEEGNVYGDWEGSDARIAWRSSPRSRDPLSDKRCARILSETRGKERRDLGDANIPTPAPPLTALVQTY